MEDGVVKEFDSVPALMGRTESSFKSMVVEAGLEGVASGSISRAASQAALAALAPGGGDESPVGTVSAASAPAGGRGVPSFARRLKEEYDLK